MSTTTSFTYSNDDELTATSSSSGGFVNSYSYNANGEQTGRTLSGIAYSLTYDYDGQISQITQGGSTTSFAYDAEGRRVSRTAGGATTKFLFAGGKILLEKQGSTTIATYAYGNDLIRKDGETPLFDGLGSERTVTNSSQTVTGTLAISAFGQTVSTTGSSSSPYMFGATSGYRNDGDAGLSHIGARYYDAQVGCFSSRDTYLDQKPYLYCEHDPVNNVDPSGHDWRVWGPDKNHPWFDFRFNREDGRAIGDGISDWGAGESIIGTAMGGPALIGVGVPGPKQIVPINSGGVKSIIITPKPHPILGPIYAVGGGLCIGGGISWVIGRIVHWANK